MQKLWPSMVGLEKYQPIMVTWMDAMHNGSGWMDWTPEDAEATLSQAICAVVGFFLGKDKHYVYVAQALNVENDKVNSIFSIPMGKTTSIFILNPKRMK